MASSSRGGFAGGRKVEVTDNHLSARRAEPTQPWAKPRETPEWKGERGRAEDLIREYMEVFDLGPGETTGYLCGHPQMIENGKGILKRAGFTKESIKEEIYWIPAKGAED